MAKKNYYAVKKGKNIGIFKTWDKCKDSVNGYPKAEYKGFATQEEAEEYLDMNSTALSSTKTAKNTTKATEEPLESNETDVAIAYVDGSYNKDKKMYGSGVLLFANEKEKEISCSGTDEVMLQMWNVAGEVCAAMIAMEEAIKLGCKKVIIYHDYSGIAGWVNGYSPNGKPSKVWNANEEGAKVYKEYAAKAKEKIEIQFVKVVAHSGNVYNNRVDKLAKMACGCV